MVARKELEQVLDRDAEAVGYLCQDVDGGVGFAVLDVREVGVVDSRHEAELAQGKFGGFSALPNGRTEPYAVGFSGMKSMGKSLGDGISWLLAYRPTNEEQQGTRCAELLQVDRGKSFDLPMPARINDALEKVAKTEKLRNFFIESAWSNGINVDQLICVLLA